MTAVLDAAMGGAAVLAFAGCMLGTTTGHRALYALSLVMACSFLGYQIGRGGLL